MIGLARFYCRKGPEFRLVDVPVKQAKNERLKLEKEGWTIAHTEIV